MTTRRQYTLDQKAAAVARVAAGESLTTVARDSGIELSVLSRACSSALAKPTTTLLREATERYLLASLETLTIHMQVYGSLEWIERAKAAELLEATRTVGSRFVAVMDRLAGQIIRDDSDG